MALEYRRHGSCTPFHHLIPGTVSNPNQKSSSLERFKPANRRYTRRRYYEHSFVDFSCSISSCPDDGSAGLDRELREIVEKKIFPTSEWEVLMFVPFYMHYSRAIRLQGEVPPVRCGPAFIVDAKATRLGRPTKHKSEILFRPDQVVAQTDELR